MGTVRPQDEVVPYRGWVDVA